MELQTDFGSVRGLIIFSASLSLSFQLLPMALVKVLFLFVSKSNCALNILPDSLSKTSDAFKVSFSDLKVLYSTSAICLEGAGESLTSLCAQDKQALSTAKITPLPTLNFCSPWQFSMHSTTFSSSFQNFWADSFPSWEEAHLCFCNNLSMISCWLHQLNCHEERPGR